MSDYNRYESPLSSRYASDYLLKLFSHRNRIRTWRELWTALARTQNQLGLPVTQEQVQELQNHLDDIDFDLARAERTGSPS